MKYRIPAAAALALAWLNLPGTALEAQTIIVGSHNLLPNTAGQQIQISVSGGAAVQGLNLYVQVGDGGPTYGGAVAGPAISGMDILSGTIFSANNSGSTPTFIGQVGEATTTVSGGSVTASGLLATLTFDTTGFASGSWALSLSHTAPGISGAPYPTDFTVVAANLTDGTINVTAVPEPSSYAAVFAVGSLAFGAYMRRKRSSR